jgi:hypothetical protein
MHVLGGVLERRLSALCPLPPTAIDPSWLSLYESLKSWGGGVGEGGAALSGVACQVPGVGNESGLRGPVKQGDDATPAMHNRRALALGSTISPICWSGPSRG